MTNWVVAPKIFGSPRFGFHLCELTNKSKGELPVMVKLLEDQEELEFVRE
jgi:hypothetical protein